MIIFCVFFILLFTTSVISQDVGHKFLVFGHDCGSQTTLMRLKKDIFCNYDETIRPVINHKNGTTVRFHIILKSFSLDVNSDILSLDTWISANWKDEGLKWSPNDYDGIKQMHLSSDEIWTPDLSVYNRYDQGTEPKLISGVTCIVSYLGHVVCVPPVHIDALCVADLTKFPFDTQNCSIMFGSWVHKGEEVNFNYPTDLLNLEDLVESGEYTLKSYKSRKNPGRYKCCPNSTYPSITLSLLLERVHSLHSANVLIPSLVCIFLTFTSICLSPDHKDRLTLCCFSVISNFFHLEYISWSLPLKGETLPFLVVLGRDSLLLSGFTVILTVILQNLIQKKTLPPAWISSIISFLIGCRPGQIVFLSDTSVRGVASAKGEDDGTTIIDNSENNSNSVNTEDWRIFARLLDRITFIYFIIQYLIIIIRFIP